MLASLGDGYLAHVSFVQLARGFVRPQPPGECVSDVPLAGGIVGVHVVRDDRTGKDVFVGGADDGSVAVWSTR